MWPFKCKRCDELEQRLHAHLSGKLGITEIIANARGMKVDFVGELLAPFIVILADWLKANGGANYASMRADYKGEAYEVIVKPLRGKMPSDLAAEYRIQAEGLAAQLKQNERATKVGAMVLEKFKSGNDTPVDRCVIKADDIEKATRGNNS